MKVMNHVSIRRYATYAKIIFFGDDTNEDYQNHTKKHREHEQSICNARYKTPKYIFGVFDNDSYYDYHFIIEVLAEMFERQFEYLRKIFSKDKNQKVNEKEKTKWKENSLRL